MRRGFTLLELSIVLVLIAVIIGGGLAVMTSSLQSSQYNATVARMDEIEKALLNYSTANSRIPCPTDLTLTTTSANYGLEAGAGTGSAITTATGVCTGTGMLPQANFKGTSGAVEGGVPTRALELPDDYMYDGWGRKFRYAVDPTQTTSNALPAAVYSLCSSPSAITVGDASGANRTTAAAYALISHGANGHGAYTSNGVVLNAGSVNASELTNCHCNSSGVATTYAPTYVEMAPTTDPTNALDNFDDIVTFKEPWQFQALNYPLAAANCKLLAVAISSSPYVTLYSLSNGVLKMLPPPAVIPSAGGEGVDFSPNNLVLAWVGGQTGSADDGMLYSVGSSGLTYASSFGSADYDMGAVKFSHSGNYLAYGGDYPYGTVASVSGTTLSTGYSPGGISYGWAWSPDDSRLYYVNNGSDFNIYTQSGGAFAPSTTPASPVDVTPYLAPGYGELDGGISVHPSGNYIALGLRGPGTGYTYPLVFGNITSASPTLIQNGLAANDGDIVDNVAWSPDGTMLAIALYDNGLNAYSFSTSTNTFTQATISGAVCPGQGEGLAWSSDGNYLAVTSDNSPYLCLYSRSGTTLTNMNIPNSLLPGTVSWAASSSVAFTH